MLLITFAIPAARNDIKNAVPVYINSVLFSVPLEHNAIVMYAAAITTSLAIHFPLPQKVYKYEPRGFNRVFAKYHKTAKLKIKSTLVMPTAPILHKQKTITSEIVPLNIKLGLFPFCLIPYAIGTLKPFFQYSFNIVMRKANGKNNSNSLENRHNNRDII